MSDLPLFSSPFAEVRRRGRHAVVELRAPALVLNTCHVNGGLRDDLHWIVNHQSCEGVKHQDRFEFITGLGQNAYHRHVCDELAIDPAKTSLMSTAAAMQYLGIATRQWDELSVTAIISAGVTGNAGSAGDAAHYDEKNGVWERITPATNSQPPSPGSPLLAPCSPLQAPGSKLPGTHHGTINTVLIFSSPLSASALTRAAITMTEAKTSALLELAVGSKSSWRLATGTGTDQFAIATPRDGATPRTWTGKHTKAGELIGQAVREAMLEALRWQNGLEPSLTRSLFHALGRFGLSEEAFKTAQENLLLERDFQLLKANWNPVIYEPQLAASAYAFAAVLERVLCGTLGASSARESLLNQAALMAAGLATQPERFPEFRRELIPHLPVETGNTAQELLPAAVALTNRAIALGWQRKWKTD